MKNYLFIGGCADGKVLETDGEDIHKVMHPPPQYIVNERPQDLEERNKVDTYFLRERWLRSPSGEVVTSIYVLSSLDAQALWQRLINNYRPL